MNDVTQNNKLIFNSIILTKFVTNHPSKIKYTVNELQSNRALIKTLFHNRISLLIITTVFFLSALGITAFIPTKYTAIGIVYPTNSNSIKEVVNRPDFGYDIQSERLIQLFESQMMYEKVIDKFDLVTYYEIDTTQNGWRYQLHEMYSKDVSFTRTKFLSVEVSVSVKNSQMGANMVNFLIDYIDTIRENLFLENTKLLVNDFAQKVAFQETIVDSLLIEIFNESNSGSSNILSENASVHIDERKRKATSLRGDDIINSVLENNYTMRVEKLVNTYYRELGILNTLQRDLINSQEKILLPFPKVYRILSAVDDKKKSSPSFFTNGLIGIICGLFFSIFYFVARLKWESISQFIKED